MKSLVSEYRSSRYLTVSTYVLFGLGLGAVLFYYWELGFLNPQASSQLIEVNSRFDEIAQFKRYDSFMNSVKDHNVRQSAMDFEQFVRSVKKVQDQIPNQKSDNNLTNESTKLKKNIASLLSLPDPQQIQRVLKIKVQQFVDYANTKKYPTLKQSAERMMSKLSDDRRLSISDLQSYSRSLRSEQEIMNRVVQSSALLPDEKQQVLSRVGAFELEISALESLAKTSLEVLKSAQTYRLLLQDWVKETGPKIAEMQIEFEKRNQSFFIALASLLGFILLLGVGQSKLIGKFQAKARKETEENIAHWLKRGLVKDEVVPFFVGPELSKDFEALKSYIAKRVQFSSSFQDALPFASILLDNNLRVIWANEIFCDTWKVDPSEIKTQGLSWDYLSQITNLGENDPVVESFQKNIPGIYQIQIRPDEGKTRIPFEMYLSPIGDGSNRKMMIFFYPLISLEETIVNQAKAIIGPVEKMFNQVSVGQWTTEVRESLAHEFEIAGISHLFEKFNSYIESQSLQRQGLMREIDNLESQVQDYHKLSHDIGLVHNDGRTETQDFRNQLQRNRETVVQLVDTTNSFDHLNQVVLNSLERNIDLASSLAVRGQDLAQYLDQGAQMSETMGQLRLEVKRAKDGMTDAKAKFLQIIDQAVLFHNRAQWEPHQLEMTFNRIKTQAREFDETVSNLEKQVSSFDVALSKLRIILEEYSRIPKIEVPNPLNLASELSDYQNKYNEQNQNAHLIQEDLVASFEDLAGRLKRIRTYWERASYLGQESLKIHDRGNEFARRVDDKLERSGTAESAIRPIRSVNHSLPV